MEECARHFATILMSLLAAIITLIGIFLRINSSEIQSVRKKVDACVHKEDLKEYLKEKLEPIEEKISEIKNTLDSIVSLQFKKD